MTNKRKNTMIFILLCILSAAFLLTGCGAKAQAPAPEDQQGSQAEEAAETEQAKADQPAQTDPSESADSEAIGLAAADPILLYMGHASIRIVTGEDKVIYIDPYAGEGYDLPADLILVTHDHYDHSALDLIKTKSDGCQVITQKEALHDKTFDLGYVSVEAVEAGNNKYHSTGECVGYVLTFSNEKKVYVTGDTSKTGQMAELADQNIDYAFFCCDGVYNMDLEEAAECAKLLQAKHNIPYHIVEADDPEHFDPQRAEEFPAPDKLILQPGEEIPIK